MHLFKKQKQTQTQNTNSCLLKGKRWEGQISVGTNRYKKCGVGINRYTLPYIKQISNKDLL